MKKRETKFIGEFGSGVQVTAMANYHDRIYVGTSEGVFFINKDEELEPVPLCDDAGFMIRTLRGLTSQQRVDIFAEFCTECGSIDPRCQCSNDE